MGKFNEFAKELNGIVAGYFDTYRTAEQTVLDIERRIKEREADKSPQAQIEVQKLRIDLNAAKDQFRTVKRQNKNALDSIGRTRSRLAKAADEIFGADPSALDSGVLRLLDSGILTVNEFEQLADKAEAAKNYTMARMIGAAAGKAAEQRFADDRNAAQRLRALSNRSKANSTDAVLRSFDEIAGAAKTALGDPNSPNRERSEPNAALLAQWDSIAGEAIAEF